VVVLRQQQNQPWPSTITTASCPATLQSGINIINAIGRTTSPDGGFTVSSNPCHQGVGFFGQSIQQTLPTSTWPARPPIFHRHQWFSRFCLLRLISIAAVWPSHTEQERSSGRRDCSSSKGGRSLKGGPHFQGCRHLVRAADGQRIQNTGIESTTSCTQQTTT
jgi:hypothetical protein